MSIAAECGSRGQRTREKKDRDGYRDACVRDMQPGFLRCSPIAKSPKVENVEKVERSGPARYFQLSEDAISHRRPQTGPSLDSA